MGYGSPIFTFIHSVNSNLGQSILGFGEEYGYKSPPRSIHFLLDLYAL